MSNDNHNTMVDDSNNSHNMDSVFVLCRFNNWKATMITNQNDINIINAYLKKAASIGLNVIEKTARNILLKHTNLEWFVMAMGTAFFVDKQGNTYNTYNSKEYMNPVWDILDEFDRILFLSGNPMKFTATGEKITNW